MLQLPPKFSGRSIHTTHPKLLSRPDQPPPPLPPATMASEALPTPPKPPLVPPKLIIFTVNLVSGLVLSQILPGALGDAHHAWSEVIAVLTMTCLSFIMINVGYEFDIDKAHVSKYISDYLIGKRNY